VEQTHCEQIVLNKIFDLWFREAIRIGLFQKTRTVLQQTKQAVNGINLLQRCSNTNCDATARCWFWDGMEHVDPIKEAKAAAARIDSQVSNLAIECAKVGLDWEDVLVQAAREQNRKRELGLTLSNNNNKNNSDTESEDDDEEEDIETDESASRTGSRQSRRNQRYDDNA
jgi:capsid protein